MKNAKSKVRKTEKTRSNREKNAEFYCARKDLLPALLLLLFQNANQTQISIANKTTFYHFS